MEIRNSCKKFRHLVAPHMAFGSLYSYSLREQLFALQKEKGYRFAREKGLSLTKEKGYLLCEQLFP